MINRIKRWIKNNSKHITTMYYNIDHEHLGYYDTYEEAIKAFKKAYQQEV